MINIVLTKNNRQSLQTSKPSVYSYQHLSIQWIAELDYGH